MYKWAHRDKFHRVPREPFPLPPTAPNHHELVLFSYTSKVCLASFCQLNFLYLINPFLIKSFLKFSSFIILLILFIISSSSCGSKYKHASPPTSGKLPAFDEIIGQDKAIASRIGIPNPSSKLGITKH